MTFATDDLANVLIAPDREFAGYGMGILRAFDRTTFANTVEYRGARLHNLTVKDRIGALTYRAGDVVLLTKWRPTGGGLASFWIDSAPVVPGEGRAEEAIEFLRGELAKQIVDDLVEELLVSPAGQELAAFVFAQRVHFDEIVDTVNTASTSYVSLTGGPTVSDVPVSESGVAIVGVQARIPIVNSSTANHIAYMGYNTSGATSVAPSDSRAKVTSHQLNDLSIIASISDQSMSWSILTGLTPGNHTFSARYRTDGGFTATYSARRIIVMAL